MHLTDSIPPRQPNNSENGFILVVVLAMTLLLALMAAAFSHAVRGQLRTVTALAAAARAEAIADGGVALALLELTETRRDASRETRFMPGAIPTSCSLGRDGWVSVAILDEAGKVNLNTTNEQLIQAFFRGLSETENEAATAIDRVLDFRDGDDTKRPQGAEAPEYLAAHGRLTGTPKNAPFDAVEELVQVLGLSAAMLARAKRWSTVHSTLSGVDPEAISPELAARLAAGAERRTGTAGTEASFATPSTLPPSLTARSDRTTFTIRSVGHTATGARFVRDAMVEFTGTGTAAYTIRRWRQSGAGGTEAAPSTGAGLPQC